MITEPLSTEPVDYTVLAGTGDRIWASFPADYDSLHTSLSTDGGRTRTTVFTWPEFANAAGGAGRFAYFGGG